MQLQSLPSGRGRRTDRGLDTPGSQLSGKVHEVAFRGKTSLTWTSGRVGSVTEPFEKRNRFPIPSRGGRFLVTKPSERKQGFAQIVLVMCQPSAVRNASPMTLKTSQQLLRELGTEHREPLPWSKLRWKSIYSTHAPHAISSWHGSTSPSCLKTFRFLPSFFGYLGFSTIPYSTFYSGHIRGHPGVAWLGITGSLMSSKGSTHSGMWGRSLIVRHARSSASLTVSNMKEKEGKMNKEIGKKTGLD